MTTVVVAIGLLGPFFAPYAPDLTVSTPFGGPSVDHPFGLDYLGRDVLSRWLWGGRSVLVLATAATLLGVVGGLCIGLVAAYRRDWLDGALMRSTDLILGFPPLLLFLLVLVAFGNGNGPLIAIIGLYHAIRMSRVVRAAAREVIVLPYIEASLARGDPARHILGKEVLPNILSPVLIDAGFRFIYSVIIIASLSFLGFGIRPPAADWGLMIAENLSALQLNPWATLVPALTLALLSVGVNLVTDAKSRGPGRLLSQESRP
ncbi:MAG: ABC transporter permease [Steroidobacteraceae bacterium]